MILALLNDRMLGERLNFEQVEPASPGADASQTAETVGPGARDAGCPCKNIQICAQVPFLSSGRSLRS